VTEPDRDRAAGSPERFVTFTDAVAAIALTLLILPLLETISDVDGDGSLRALLREHTSQLWGFAMSYAVIFQFWWGHHRMFRHLAQLNYAIVRWSQLWTFAIVFMPITTAITATFEPSPGTVGLYGGTLVVASGSMSVIAWLVYRHPELNAKEWPATREHVFNNVAVFITLLVATLIGCLFADAVGYWAFVLMFLTNPAQRLVKTRWRRRR
jgi:uncharacterized membrane protein